MSRSVYRYTFAPVLPADEAECTLLLALFAVEDLHGEAQVLLDAAHAFDAGRRACVIDATTAVGRDLARLFTGLLRRQFGAGAFEVERLSAARATAVAPCP